MMLNIPIKLIILIASLMCVITFQSSAKSPAKVSLEQASEAVRIQSKGKVLSARTTRTINGAKIHKIKILTPNGRVKTHSVHARESLQNNNYSANNKNTFRSPSQNNTNTSNSSKNTSSTAKTTKQ
jgi:hypothetical protein